MKRDLPLSITMQSDVDALARELADDYARTEEPPAAKQPNPNPERNYIMAAAEMTPNTNDNMKEKRKLNRMTQANFYRLCHWFSNLSEEERKFTPENIAAKATLALDTKITETNIEQASTATGVKLIRPVRTKADKIARLAAARDERNRLYTDRVQAVAVALVGLYATVNRLSQELGVQGVSTPESLLDVAKRRPVTKRG